MQIHSIENVFDDGDFVSLGLVGLDIRAAQRSEVVQHQMDGDIKWSRTARGIWLLATPSTNGKACPIKTFRQWPMLQPETLDFDLNQAFDGPDL